MSRILAIKGTMATGRWTTPLFRSRRFRKGSRATKNNLAALGNSFAVMIASPVRLTTT